MKINEKPLLSILITSYNRDLYVDKLLSILFDYQKKGLSFFVVLSDDSSDNKIKKVSDAWQGKFIFYKYVATDEHLGMDNNFRTAYENCETEYCWLLGDYRYVEFEKLSKIIELLSEKKYDALILKCRENFNVPSKEYNDINILMSEQGWHITNNSSFIIPSYFINKKIYSRYMGTCFLHMGLCIDNLCLLKNFNVAYLSDILVKGIQLEGHTTPSSWLSHSFREFARLWYTFVLSLPNQVELTVKKNVILEHNKNTGIFSFKTIINSRLDYGDLYKQSFKKNREYLKFVSTTPLFLYDLAFALPIKPYLYLKKIWHYIKLL